MRFVALLALVVGCVEPAPYTCAIDADCTVAGVAGHCNADGVCEAAPDPLPAGRLCLPGVALPADDPCTAQVCATRPWCCTTGWTENCVHAAETACHAECTGVLAGAGFSFAGAGPFDGTTYSSQWTATNTGWVFVAEWGDYDGDGHGDLAVGREQQQPGAGLSIYPWNPSGSPLLGDPLTIGGEPIGSINALEWVDVGNDGKLDIIAGGDGGIYLVTQDDSGAFTSRRLSPSTVETIGWVDDDGQAPYRVAIGYRYIDMPDPTPDIPSHVVLHQLDGNPLMLDAGIPVGDFGTGDLVFCQVTGGPGRDLLIGTYPAHVAAASAAGFDAPSQIDAGGYRVECADMDGDGDDDVVLSGGFSDPVDLFINDGGITTPQRISGSLVTDGLDVGDYDRDGDLDIVTSSRNEVDTPMTVLRNNSVTGQEPEFFVMPAADWNGAEWTAFDLDLGPAD